METSNSPEPVESTGLDAASTSEQVQDTNENVTPEIPQVVEKEPSFKEKILSLKDDKATAPKVKETAAPKSDAAPDATPEAPTTEEPKYEPNLKYKAFGKEKELDPFWSPLIKDAESEKKVKEVFTRADAFDDMKSRYETSSVEHQKVLQQFTSLDRDVKRVTKFLNTGDYDNFFQSLRISDDMLLQHLQRKAEIANLSPVQQQAYMQGVQQRADYQLHQEQYEQLQANYANQATQHRTMQLDMVLTRPEVNNAASVWDSKMGLGAFRQLVIQEAANHYHATKEDLPAEGAVSLVLQRFGKLLEQPAPQAQAPTPGSVPAAPQTPQTTVVQGKPVIPNVNGRGTSPVKQAPKSLDDLRKMAKAARMAESDGLVADTM